MATLADSFLADFDDDDDDKQQKPPQQLPKVAALSGTTSVIKPPPGAVGLSFAAGATTPIVKTEIKPEPRADAKAFFAASASGSGSGSGANAESEVKDLDAMGDDGDDSESDDEEGGDEKGGDAKQSGSASGSASGGGDGDDEDGPLTEAGAAIKRKLKREAKVKTETAASSSAATTAAMAGLGAAQRSVAVRQIATLLHDPKLAQHLELLSLLQSQSVGDGEGESAEEKRKATHSKGVERMDEYNIIVKSNEMTVEIDNEILIIFKFIRDLYSTRFHELEQLVPNPLEYARCVKIVGNQTDTSQMGGLQGLLPQNVIMMITVSLSSTIGKPLSADDLKRVNEACDAIIALDEAKKNIFSYIESRMGYIAPNLSAIVGSDIAARLIGTAGGLGALSKIPSCNLQVLGQTKKTIVGFSTAMKDLHMGLLAAVDLMQQVPAALKNRTLRLIAAKCILAARIDSFQDDHTGDKGAAMRDHIETKVAKWQDPPAPKKPKPLPAPNDTPRKKRGGKRYRKQKERFQQTELTKAKNRMIFGKEELTDEYTGEGYGSIGQAGSGQLMLKAKNTQKLSKHLSKKTQERLKKEQLKKSLATASAARDGGVGTASSIVFTPVQGIELVNPAAAAAKVREANIKYFNATGTFAKVGAAKTPAGAASTLPPVPKFAAPTPRPPTSASGAASASASASAGSSSGSGLMPPPPPKRQKVGPPTAAAPASSTSYNEHSQSR